MLRKTLSTGLILAAVISLSSCYQVPIPQGNLITPNVVNKVHKGMSKQEVVNAIGDPVLNNTFVNGETAYVYTFKKGFHRMKKKRLIVYFRNNRVVRTFADDNFNSTIIPAPGKL